jgi:hypothetical protein
MRGQQKPPQKARRLLLELWMSAAEGTASIRTPSRGRSTAVPNSGPAGLPNLAQCEDPSS